MTAVPLVGERLWIERRKGSDLYRAHRIRIAPMEKAQLAIVAGKRRRCLPARKVEAHGEGTIIVPVGDTVDAAPLTADEEAEYDRLDRLIAGRQRDDHALLRPFFSLLHRSRVYGSELVQ